MTMEDGFPEFPLTVTAHRSGDAWTVATMDDLLGAVGVFSTDDPSQAASVMDGRGRLTRLVIQNHQILAFELLAGWPSFESP